MAAERTTADERLDAAVSALHAATTQMGRLRHKLGYWDEREREAASENVSFAIKEIEAARERDGGDS
jgi:hypothetical protein